MNLQFDKAKPDDQPAILLLYQAATSAMLAHGLHQWDSIYPNADLLQEDIQQSCLYIGTMEDKIALAFVLNASCNEEYALACWTTPDHSFLVLHRLCVHPNFQGKGLATLAMRYIEAQLLSEKITSIRLDVFSQNHSAIKLYTSLGYRRTGSVFFHKGLFYLMEKSLQTEASGE